MKNKLLSFALFNAVTIHGLLSSSIGYAESLYAVGTYSPGPKIDSLLMVQSNDNGMTWNNGLTTKQNSSGMLFSLSCTADSCVAVGGQVTKTGEVIPVSYHKNKSAKDWQSTKVEKQSSQSFFIKTLCQDSHCYAIGLNIDAMSPMLASSSDNGKNWTFVKKIDNKPTTKVLKLVESDHMACNTSFCVVIGNKRDYNIDSTFVPVIVTTGKDNKWSTRSLNLTDEVVLTSVSCDEEFCMIIGSKNDSEPFIAITDDEGKSWHFPLDDSEQQFPIDIANAQLHDISCSDKACVIVGVVKDSNGESLKPLFLKSNDHGKTWQFPDNLVDNDSFNKYPDAYVQSVNCYHQRCVAVGSYKSETGINMPFLAISNDAAKTWAFPQEIYSQYPKGFTAGELSSVVCSDTGCTAFGSQERSDEPDPLFVVLDNNTGLWSYSGINKESMPEDYKKSTIYAIAR